MDQSFLQIHKTGLEQLVWDDAVNSNQSVHLSGRRRVSLFAASLQYPALLILLTIVISRSALLNNLA